MITETEPLVRVRARARRVTNDVSMAPALRETFAERFESGSFRIEKNGGLFVARKGT